jgi:hypothetical protein
VGRGREGRKRGRREGGESAEKYIMELYHLAENCEYEITMCHTAELPVNGLREETHSNCGYIT